MCIYLLGTTVDRSQGTALQKAVGAGNPIIVQMLLEAGADVHAKNEFGQTLRAQMAKIYYRISDTVETLLLRAEAGDFSGAVPTK